MKRIFVANWKMYKTRTEAVEFLESFIPLLKRRPGREIVICPSFPVLETMTTKLKTAGQKGKMIQIGAQNAHFEFSGAFTGEVSVDQLKEIGCHYVILGHSERRRDFAETDEIINKKVISALRVGLMPIICVGESEMERKTGKTMAILKRQLRGTLAGLSQKNKKNVIIAYEPVWAIGTGLTPTLYEIEDAHQTIRQTSGVACILYGGSVNVESIKSLLSSKEINGFLVGSASLDAVSFGEMVNAS